MSASRRAIAADDQVRACARPRAAISARSCASPSTRTTAAANAARSSGTISAPLPGSTERVPSSAVDTTGTPCAIASSSTSPCVSVREANTNTLAAA